MCYFNLVTSYNEGISTQIHSYYISYQDTAFYTHKQIIVFVHFTFTLPVIFPSTLCYAFTT